MALKQRFPWVVVSAGVALSLVAVTAWLRIPVGGGQGPAPATLPALELTRVDPSAAADELLTERLAAYDPTPMFMPAAMSSQASTVPLDNRPGAGGPFAALRPQLTKESPLNFPSAVPLPATAITGLRLTERPDAPLALSRADAGWTALNPRAGQIEVVAVNGGGVVLTLAVPASVALPREDWQPVEMLGAVTQSGLAGSLVITTSSGLEEIDDFLRSYLQENVRIGCRLTTGFYIFRIGP